MNPEKRRARAKLKKCQGNVMRNPLGAKPVEVIKLLKRAVGKKQ